MTTSLPSRRILVATGMVGAPICLAVGNLLAVNTGTTPAQTVAAISAHTGQYLAASVIQAAGFALLGAVGVGIAMLVRHRGSALATVAALFTLIGGVVMGGTVLAGAFVEAALSTGDGASALAALQSNAGLGALFEFSIVAGLGGLLGAVALLVGRPVPIWVSLLLLVGVVLSSAGGGALGAALTLPFLIAIVFLARALVRGARVPEAARITRGETVAA